MKDPGIVQALRATALIIGIGMVAFVLVAASAIINDTEREAPMVIFLVTGWVLLVAGFRLARVGMTGQATALDRLRASAASRESAP